MSRKLVTVLVTVFTVMLLTGCNTDKKAVTETVEGFLNAMVSNDMEAASQYATEEFMNSDTIKLMDPNYLADTFYAAMNVQKEDMGEEAQNAVNEYVKNVVDKAYKSFEIQDVKVQEDDTAAVTAKIILGYNPESSSSVPAETVDVVNEYQTEHYDELISIYTEEGEKAMYKKIYNDLIPIVIGKMQEALENSATSEEKTILTLQKTDKKWLITNLEEKRPAANTAVTAEEAAAAVSTSDETEYASEEMTSDEYAAESATSDEYASESASTGDTAETAAEEETSH